MVYFDEESFELERKVKIFRKISGYQGVWGTLENSVPHIWALDPDETCEVNQSQRGGGGSDPPLETDSEKWRQVAWGRADEAQGPSWGWGSFAGKYPALERLFWSLEVDLFWRIEERPQVNSDNNWLSQLHLCITVILTLLPLGAVFALLYLFIYLFPCRMWVISFLPLRSVWRQPEMKDAQHFGTCRAPPTLFLSSTLTAGLLPSLLCDPEPLISHESKGEINRTELIKLQKWSNKVMHRSVPNINIHQIVPIWK